ncbi:Methyltransferase domain-containing protein [Sphingobium sp. AP50]|uniref:class I SAM-dependent methyltransferase n=1 Tax=Sphingobium sp. AP50 TaxID=1884369 RepID=UPI0008C8AC87|nr:class I SAM-dependent methyltransferase [Sphingobium sp. AP50]SEJ96452.1 Methyltransferase domain-containing protein [Sphingobium sp. AP50]
MTECRPAQPFDFTPVHDEMARLNFVGALKKYVNFTVEAAFQDRFDKEIAPAHARAHGQPPANRKEAGAASAADPLFQLWASLTWHSQNMMWDTVQQTTDRIIDDRVATFRTIRDQPASGGSLHLNDQLVVKAPVKTTEIHRQPGGYWRERRPDDIEAGLVYTGTVEMYRAAKGMSAGKSATKDTLGQFVAQVAARRAPDLVPTAVLDMGCGTAEQTHAYKRLWPDADVHGLDCARPFVRYAHGAAESAGLAIHFHELDAAETGFPGASFDFITSIIMFHETSAAQVPRILKECWRLLKPGGLVLHLDVPYHAHRIPLAKQVTNDWQVRHNGEPFWTGFVDLDMKAELEKAGFDPQTAFADYEAVGPAAYFFFGGRKP